MQDEEPWLVTIRRYARSRLYDGAAGRYVSVETLRGWAAEGRRLEVVDAETGEDVTGAVLA